MSVPSIYMSGGHILGGAGGVFALPGGSQSGQLAAGHWVPAKMTLTSTRVVIPRPDTETGSAAYTRNAHPNIPYQCPVKAQGGAYPLYYSLTSGPAGASIGQFYNSTNYGIVTWPSPTSGTQTFSVLVTDQDGVQVTVTWTVVVGTSWVFFVGGSGASDSNPGTFASPWATYAHAVSTVTGGKAVCLRAGSYTVPSSAVSLSSTTHNALFAYPGESVTIDCSTSTANEGCWNENSADEFIAGILFSSGPNVANPRCFSNFASVNRMYKWNCSFDNPVVGSAGSGAWDNQSCWFLGDPGSQRSYLMMLGCTFSRLPPGGNGYFTLDTYNSKYLIFDENNFTTPNSNPAQQYSIFIKGGGNQEISVRNNLMSLAWEPEEAILGLYLGDDGTGTNSTDQEFCYNTFVNVNTAATWDSFSVLVNNAQNNSQPATVWSYRNTIVGIPCITYQSVNVLTFTSQDDAIVHNATASGLTGKWIAANFAGAQNSFVNPTTIPSIVYSISGVECQGNTSAGILDASNLLTGTFRTNYLYIRGAEIG